MEVASSRTFAPAAIAMIGIYRVRSPTAHLDRVEAQAAGRARRELPLRSTPKNSTNSLACARVGGRQYRPDTQADPVVPPNLYNRAADNWRPLLAIADAAGGEWPERARILLHHGQMPTRRSASGSSPTSARYSIRRRMEKISVCRTRRGARRHRRAPLGGIWQGGRPLSANGLARLLAGDHISPGTVRFGPAEETDKGYGLEQFADAFARYLPAPPNPTVTPSQAADPLGFRADPQPSQDGQWTVGDISKALGFLRDCDGVTVENRRSRKESERKRLRL